MSNRSKFVELAEKRVTKVLKDISLIGNLSNRTNYQYTDEDIKKIFTAIESEIRSVKKKFVSLEKDDSKKFTLD